MSTLLDPRYRKKTIYFDMDGTLADLYGVRPKVIDGQTLNVFQRLDMNDARVYDEAAPISSNVRMLKELKRRGYRIGIITAGSRFPPGTSFSIQAKMNSDTQRYKRQWLARNGIVVDEFKFVPYGTPKMNAASDRNGILVDDETKVLNNWPGLCVFANPKNAARF